MNKLASKVDRTEVKNVFKVLVGHTPVKESLSLGNVIYIDTGAVWTNKLTIVQIQ